MKTDTIAAIATALSDAGIGIIRISGEDAVKVGNAVFRTREGKEKLNQVKSHTIHYGYIVDLEEHPEKDFTSCIIDEVMVTVMKAPNTYTREDTVEINCHGGVLVMKKVLETVLKYGARLAEPGEFTKRAFLNGRIDLSRAEAVMDVIHSQNEYALTSSLNQLKGNLFKEIKNLRDKILYETAFIESALDDPEHISLEGYSEEFLNRLLEMMEGIEGLLATADNGKLMKEGISTVIVGKPNAGKSSLMNILSGEDKAIVTEIAGTTRDVLEEDISLHGIGFHIIDTAGIRNTEDAVEKIGVQKAKKYAMDADLIIYMVDASVELDESDREIISLLGEKNTIILLNKSDLNSIVTEEKINKLIEEILPVHKKAAVIKTSTKDQTGIDVFENTVKDMFFQGELKSNHQIVITSTRHKAALSEAFESLYMVKKSIEDGMPEDFYSIDLMSAYAALGKITGEEVEEDLVKEIFSSFCMGK